MNGPEVLNKYVGASEERIRDLFADAATEQADVGDASGLHIIIFDELDAICKQRGSSRDGTGVSDSIVNQLLSKMDGVDSLHNILVIGMTNRKDMIDEALLRPGRLEVHVEIGLPSEAGRLQILHIHTKEMAAHGHLSVHSCAALPELARRSKNFSGAEIEGLVRSAASFAFNRQVDVKHLDRKVEKSSVVVEPADFDRALNEILPAFGSNSSELDSFVRQGVLNYSPGFEALRDTLQQLVKQVRTSSRTPLLSVLLEGVPGAGKTALAVKAAIESEFPFARIITADALLGYTETQRVSLIHKMFTDAYKSPLSLLILDDLERLLEYTPLGPRFANGVLQALLVLIKKTPPLPTNPTHEHEHERKLCILATTSCAELLADMGLVAAFDVTLNVPQLSAPGEIRTVLAELAFALTTASEQDLDAMAASVHHVRAACCVHPPYFYTPPFLQPIAMKKLLMVSEMTRTMVHTHTHTQARALCEDDVPPPPPSLFPAAFADALISCGF